MKNWTFKVKNNVQDIITKLDATFGSAHGFVFNINNDKNDSPTFKVRKRGLYAFYLMFVNKIIVTRKILKTDIKNETYIEISFTQYFLWKLLIGTHLFLAISFLIRIVLKANSNPYMYIIGVLFLVIAIILWITVQNKFKKDIQEYKTLISGILKP